MIINAPNAQQATIYGSNIQPAAITTAYKDLTALADSRESMSSRHRLVHAVLVILAVNFVQELRINVISVRIIIIYWMIKQNVLLPLHALYVLIHLM